MPRYYFHLEDGQCLLDENGLDLPDIVAAQDEAESRPQESERDDKWSFCLTAGTLCPANQEKQ